MSIKTAKGTVLVDPDLIRTFRHLYAAPSVDAICLISDRGEVRWFDEVRVPVKNSTAIEGYRPHAPCGGVR